MGKFTWRMAQVLSPSSWDSTRLQRPLQSWAPFTRALFLRGGTRAVQEADPRAAPAARWKPGVTIEYGCTFAASPITTCNI
jgi:hypothetical protein